MHQRTRLVLLAVVAVVALAGVYVWLSRPSSSESLSIAQLSGQTHFHGLAIDPADSSRLLLATHRGFYSVTSDGTARRISENTDDLMGFMLHPRDSRLLYASGHPAGGGNLGFMVSTDGGSHWKQIAPGAVGVADFHNMAMSAADASTIYGAYAGSLQVSHDSGGTWSVVGDAPEGLLDLAASSQSPATLYAGTKFGLLRSADGGHSWESTYPSDDPVPLVQVAPGGAVFAFVVGTGLVQAKEPNLKWQVLGKGIDDRFMIHLAVDPRDQRRLYAISIDRNSNQQEILASADGGASWVPLGSGAKTE